MDILSLLSEPPSELTHCQVVVAALQMLLQWMISGNVRMVAFRSDWIFSILDGLERTQSDCGEIGKRRMSGFPMIER